MKKSLEEYLKEITSVFRRNNDLYKAHALAAPVLKEMAADMNIFHEIIKRNLLEKDFLLSNRINPVIALPINKTEYYTLVANCWLPLPDKNPAMTHQSIHHHGNLLLSSVAPIGPGYTSVLFKKGYKINPDNTTEIEIDKIYSNEKGSLEFIDTYTPHVVFYPQDFSVTYALWSETSTSMMLRWKKSSFIQKYKKQAKEIFSLIGMDKKIGLNAIEQFDFYPSNGKIISMKNREMYPVGSNDSFIGALFYILYKSGFKDHEFLKKLGTLKSGKEYEKFELLLNKYLAGKEFQSEFESCHLGIDKVNFSREELLRCFPSFSEG